MSPTISPQPRRLPADSDPWSNANLRLMRHAHTRATAMPADLVEAQARANSKCEKIWREAKAAADFGMVRSALTEVVNLVRQQASALGEALGMSPYDALMDGYQRGIGASDVASIFGGYEISWRKRCPGGTASGATGSADNPQGPSRSRCRRSCAAGCPRGSVWTSTTPGWTARRTRFPAVFPPMCASPRAMTRPISPRRSWR